MLIMLVSEDTFVDGETIEALMASAIRNGYYDNEEDFVDRIENAEIYKLPEKPLTITGVMGKPTFTILEQ